MYGIIFLAFVAGLAFGTMLLSIGVSKYWSTLLWLGVFIFELSLAFIRAGLLRVE